MLQKAQGLQPGVRRVYLIAIVLEQPRDQRTDLLIIVYHQYARHGVPITACAAQI